MNKELAPDWSNRNTITGQVMFDGRRTRKGTFTDPELLMDNDIYKKLNKK